MVQIFHHIDVKIMLKIYLIIESKYSFINYLRLHGEMPRTGHIGCSADANNLQHWQLPVCYVMHCS